MHKRRERDEPTAQCKPLQRDADESEDARRMRGEGNRKGNPPNGRAMAIWQRLLWLSSMIGWVPMLRMLRIPR